MTDVTKDNPIPDGGIPASGLLAMGGFIFYGIGCVFFVADPDNPTLRFHADGIGDDFDVDTSEMEGYFTKPPSELAGKCNFRLETADDVEGIIVLTILQDDEVVGRFTGDAEGFGEALLPDGTGKLTIPATKEHNNNISFVGDDTITSISFVYGNVYSITDGQPWGEVETTALKTNQKGNPTAIRVDVGAGRHQDGTNADWYNAIVGGDPDKMIHTRGEDGNNGVPTALNFAIKGVLTINGDAFNICLGQGTSGTYDNWDLASENMESSSSDNYGVGNLVFVNSETGQNHIYQLSQDGSDTFNVTCVTQ